jgi:hypothetical protein
MEPKRSIAMEHAVIVVWGRVPQQYGAGCSIRMEHSAPYYDEALPHIYGTEKFHTYGTAATRRQGEKTMRPSTDPK